MEAKLTLRRAEELGADVTKLVAFPSLRQNVWQFAMLSRPKNDGLMRAAA
jgi:hypothetical protein